MNLRPSDKNVFAKSNKNVPVLYMSETYFFMLWQKLSE